MSLPHALDAFQITLMRPMKLDSYEYSPAQDRDGTSRIVEFPAGTVFHNLYYTDAVDAFGYMYIGGVSETPNGIRYIVNRISTRPDPIQN